jgi:hypothetical protein
MENSTGVWSSETSDDQIGASPIGDRAAVFQQIGERFHRSFRISSSHLA